MAATLNEYGAYVTSPNYGLGRRCNYEKWRFGTGEWPKLLDEANDGG